MDEGEERGRGGRNFISFLQCFRKKSEFCMNWKNTCQEGFTGSIKIGVTFFGFLLGKFNV